jgi:hypothetical protein
MYQRHKNCMPDISVARFKLSTLAFPSSDILVHFTIIRSKFFPFQMAEIPFIKEVWIFSSMTHCNYIQIANQRKFLYLTSDWLVENKFGAADQVLWTSKIYISEFTQYCRYNLWINVELRYWTRKSVNRLLARWDAPRTKNGRLWTPKFWGKREIIFNYFPKYINISEMK